MAWLVDKDYHTPQPFFRFEGPNPYRMAAIGPCLNYFVSYPEVLPVARSETKVKKGRVARDVFFAGGVTCCNLRFRELVEQFEPGMHIFAPIRLLDLDGSEIEGPFFHFTTQQDVDCIVTDNAPEWFRMRNPKDPETNIISNIGKFDEKRYPDIFLSSPAISGKHLWTAGLLAWSYLFISDDFRDAWSKARMTGFQIKKKCKLADRAWIAEEQMGPMLADWQRYVDHGRAIAGSW